MSQEEEERGAGGRRSDWFRYQTGKQTFGLLLPAALD